MYSKGVQSDDSRLSFRHIYSKVLTIRAKLFTEKINKRQPVSQWDYQTLNCVELIPAKPYECPCLPSVGCVILRTKYKLPQPLTGLTEGHIIQSVTSLEGSVNYSPTTWEDKKYKKGAKYTSDKPDYYIREDYLFITTKKGPKAITITGLFDDPLLAADFPSMCEEPCVENCKECISPLDRDIPIAKDMIDVLVELSSLELLGEFSKGREDESNNSKDSLKEESK